MIATLARVHAPTVRAALDVLHPDGRVIEARILKTEHGTVSGYFDDKAKLAEAVAPYDGKHNIYVTLNPVSPDLLARANNRLKKYVRVTTQDAEILCRQWFPIDLDAVRPADISSTDAEMAAAIAKRDELVSYLCNEGGYPEMVLANSGNGAHALVRCSFPNTPDIAALFQGALHALAHRFDDAQVKIDPAVFNAARIWKLYGTIAAKGDPIPTRLHRRAEITSAPDAPVLLTREQLKWLSAQAPEPVARTYSVPSERRYQARDLLAEFQGRGLYLKALAPPKHAVTCPWQSEHSTDSGLSETCIFEPATPDAPWGFDCKHSHCSERTIKDVLALFRNGAEFERAAAGTAPEREDEKPARQGLSQALIEYPDLLTLEIPERRRYTPWLPEASSALAYGPRGVGKTMFGLGLASALVTGEPFLRWPITGAVGCLYIDGEMQMDELRARATALLPTPPKAPLRFLTSELAYHRLNRDLVLTSDETREEVAQLLDQHPEIRVVIFDNISTLFAGIDEDRKRDWEPIAAWLIRLRHRRLATVLIHHSGKGGQQRGTSGREDSLDTVLQLNRPAGYDPRDGCHFELRFTKSRSVKGEDVAPLDVTLTEQEGQLRWAYKTLEESRFDQVKRLLEEGVTSPTEIAAEMEISKGYASKLVRRVRAEQEQR